MKQFLVNGGGDVWGRLRENFIKSGGILGMHGKLQNAGKETLLSCGAFHDVFYPHYGKFAIFHMPGEQLWRRRKESTLASKQPPTTKGQSRIM